MLQTIRDRATGWIAYIIIGLLIIPFALWGINQYFNGSGAVDAAEVGDTKISLQEFQRAYQQQRLRLQNLMGGNFDPATLDESKLKIEVLQQLINERVLLQTARKEGFRVGDQQLNEAIRSYEAFQQDGKFDNELYQRVLRAQGYTSIAFEEGLRNSLVASQLQQGVIASSIVTPAELDQIIDLLTQKRELSYVSLSLDKYLKSVSVDESAIETYYQDNKSRFLNPERVRVQYIELGAEQLAKDIPVSEEELQEAYKEQIGKYTQDEERKASHILITVAQQGASEADVEKARARAQMLHDEIAAGSKTFEQALQEAQAQGGAEGGELGTINKGMMDQAFESALFALQRNGDISEPVKTPFGFHIIRLEGITPQRVKSFAEVHDQVAQDLRRRKAEARFYDEAEKLYNLSYEHPDSLEPAAKALGLKLLESPWFTRTGGEGIAAHAQVVKAAFSDEVLNRGLNSEPIEVETNHVVVLRKLDQQEATPQTLDQARADIERELRAARARDALRADAAAIRERAGQGEGLEALAKEFGAAYKAPTLLSRTDPSVDPAVLAEAFQMAAPAQGKASFGSASLAGGGQAVIGVTQVAPGKPEDLPESERTALERRLAGQAGVAEFEALLESLRQQSEIVMHTDKL